MNQQLFYFPSYQALSSSGAPLAGAKLRFFETGTTNAAVVYADVARTTALANPVVADTQGRFPQIYPNPEFIYRVRLSDASDVQQWQQDGVGLQLFPATQAEVDAGVTPVNTAFPPGNVKRYGAKGDGGTDDTLAIANAINACIKQYDPTQKTHDGNNVTYRGKQVAVYFPAGIYRITGTLNLSFRNDWELFGESEWSTRIEYDGPANGTIVDARCSNYLHFHNIGLGGKFKAKRFIHCAGNGTNAPGSKGNVTGNRFSHVFFWNQMGDLLGPYNDYPDTYDHSFAMLDLVNDTGVKGYDSCDDSTIEYCRFAPNSLNNYFGIAIGSSALSVNECYFFAANGILACGGANFAANDCMFGIYAPQVMDGSHNHAAIKYDNAGVISVISLQNCYMESGDYYNNGNTAVVAYCPADPTAPSDASARIQLTIAGGLYSVHKNSVPAISIGTNRFGVVNIDHASFQGVNQGLIYAPNCLVNIDTQGSALSYTTDNHHPWQPTTYAGVTLEYSTADFNVRGSRLPTANVTIQEEDFPARLKFFSIDEALAFVSRTEGRVVITLAKNATITQEIALDSDITIDLGGFTLTCNAVVKNFGNLTINGAGAAVSTARKLYNYNNLNLVSCTVNALVTSIGGTTYAKGCTFAGTDDSIGVTGESRVVIDHATSVYSGSQFVVSLASNVGTAVVNAPNGGTPTTGRWARGTLFRNLAPSSGAPVQWYATADGVGSAANWRHQGNLA